MTPKAYLESNDASALAQEVGLRQAAGWPARRLRLLYCAVASLHVFRNATASVFRGLEAALQKADGLGSAALADVASYRLRQLGKRTTYSTWPVPALLEALGGHRPTALPGVVAASPLSDGPLQDALRDVCGDPVWPPPPGAAFHDFWVACACAGMHAGGACPACGGSGACPSWVFPALPASCRTPDVAALALAVYCSRGPSGAPAMDPSGMPALGDALEEAGCDSELILRHCRGQRPDGEGGWRPARSSCTRGCRVLNLCLGHEW